MAGGRTAARRMTCRSASAKPLDTEFTLTHFSVRPKSSSANILGIVSRASVCKTQGTQVQNLVRIHKFQEEFYAMQCRVSSFTARGNRRAVVKMSQRVFCLVFDKCKKMPPPEMLLTMKYHFTGTNDVIKICLKHTHTQWTVLQEILSKLNIKGPVSCPF